MALRYEWSWDFAQIGPAAVRVTDDGGTFDVRLSLGHYCHTNISSVASGVTDFATALQTALNAGTSSGTYAVQWFSPYNLQYDGTSFALNFTAVTAAEGLLMRRILGFSANVSGLTEYDGDVRPYYLILPSIQGRSQMSDEYEPTDIMAEAVADDGSVYQVARDTTEIHSDWAQQAETETGPASAFADGTLAFKRHATAAAPWTYQHAFEHHRAGNHPFLVIDGSEQAVHRLRADGSSFMPQRFAGVDQPHWSIPFRTRLLGRL